MANALIRPMSGEYEEYLRDESRSVGKAESISFPRTTEDVSTILKEMYEKKIPVTVQGSRTGLAAAAVPYEGHAMNMSRMDKVLSCRQDEQTGTFYFTLQPGVLLSELRKMISGKRFQTADWTEEAKAAYTAFCRAPEQFFTPDPTETSASLGGMVNCNASGARSFHYGSVRGYINGLKVVLMDGETLTLRRGEQFAQGREGTLWTDSGKEIHFTLPSYQMPHTKNASGYYAEDNMDLIDLFIGSDGTLGVTCEIEIRLLPLPQIIWGVTAFFDQEEKALRYVRLIRGEQLEGCDRFDIHPVSAEFFNGDALEILRREKRENSAFAQIHDIPQQYETAIYVELHGDTEEDVTNRLLELGKAIQQAGGKEEDTWVARSQTDLDRLMFFRHAIPECVNMLIDQRKKKNKEITKLGTDMAVPDAALEETMAMYNTMLKERGLQSAIWGHVGNNHLHVNILPNDSEEYRKGKELYNDWAAKITAKGGAVSAEHGVGKLKAGFLKVMYGEEHIGEMRQLKKAFDPQNLLNRGNLFAPEEENK